MKKILCLILALALLASPMTGCGLGGDGGEEQVDPNRTQLYVGFFEGGWGRKWLEQMDEAFEALYPEVQVMIDGKKDEYTNNNLQVSIEAGRNDIYFTTIVPQDIVSSGKLMDIDDIVRAPLTEFGEQRSIADKMDPFMKEYMLSSNKENKYYTIPMYTSFYNVVYDVDLFEEKALYFDENGGFTKGTAGSAAKSAGQDNIAGTLDDGLPVTWGDYKRMLNKMTDSSITPFIWSNTIGYRRDMLSALWASHEGADNFNLSYTLDGSEYNGTVINETNGYELQKQPGKKAALEFAEYIIVNGMYDDRAFYSSLDFLQAQDEYLYSKYHASAGTGRRIGLLIEGGWWENEAKNTIELMAEQYGEEYQNRRFGIMTFPRFDGGATSKTMFSVTTNSCVFIRSNAAQPEWAKKFLQFTTTDEMLRLYNRLTGSTRAYDYELTQDDLNQMSYFKQSLWDIYNNEETRLVYAHGPGRMALANAQYFRNDWHWSAALSDGTVLSEPFNDFKQYRSAKNLTKDTYADALYTYHKTRWSNLHK